METTLQHDDARKLLVKRAKQRMMNNDYREHDALAAAEPKREGGASFGEIENLDHLIAVVREIKNSDSFVVDPLKRMMDEGYYQTLNENEKMGYILKVSKIYKELSEKIEIR